MIGSPMNDTHHNDALLVLELRILMSTTAKILRHSLEQCLAEQGIEISALQYSILRSLTHEAHYTITELSRTYGLDPSTLVPAVDALERKGMITRQRDPDDRRRFPLSLTEVGHAFIQQIPIVGDDDPLLIGLRSLGPTDAHTLLNLTRALVRALPDGDDLLSAAQERLQAYRTAIDPKATDPS